MSHFLSIMLDKPDGVSGLGVQRPAARRFRLFIPGEQVIGKVVLKLEKDSEISGVVIRFRGKCKSQVPHGDNSISHKFFMFTFEKQLFKGPFKLKADTYEWPFSFAFPEHFEMKGNPFEGKSSKFLMGKQPLPPSMVMRERDTEAHVQYKLQARVPCHVVGWKAKINLNFTPVRLEALPDPQFISRKQMQPPWTEPFRYTEDFVPRPLTAKEKLRSIFHTSSDNHNITFSFSASAPTSIVIGKPYPLTLTLNSEPTDMVMPSFILQSARAHLDAETYLRVPGVFRDHEKYEENNIELYHTHHINFELPPNQPVTLKHFFPAVLDAPPTFSSPSLIRTYKLSLHFKITVLEEEFSVACKFPRVTLFAARMENGVEEAIGTGNQAVPPYEGPGDAPPVYEAKTLTSK